jgi:hypothetical protein
LQYEGALKAWSKVIGRCSARTAEFTKQLPETPGTVAELVVEERFAVGEKPKSAIPTEDPLLVLHAVAQLDIDAAGNLSSCRVEGTGIMPPGLPPDVCAMVPKQYMPLKGALGTAAPFTAYFDLAWYIHVNEAAAPERG